MLYIVDRLFWGAVHRFHPKHRYNIVRMKSLEPGYYDPDTRMLHACFDLFSEWFEYNYIENEFGDMTTVEGMEAFKEYNALNNFWTELRPQMQEEIRNLYSNTSTCDAAYEREQQLERLEDDMLLRLMKVRRHIWYL